MDRILVFVAVLVLATVIIRHRERRRGAKRAGATERSAPPSVSALRTSEGLYQALGDGGFHDTARRLARAARTGASCCRSMATRRRA